MDSIGKKGINQILCSLLSRGCKGYDNFRISEYIDSHGAELNFETSEDYLLINLKSQNNYFKKLYPLINLIINNPILSKKQFEYVKESLIYSLKKEKENPFNIVYENWRKIVYKNHPYAFNCLGYLEDVVNIKYNDILEEYESFKLRKKYLISNSSEIKYKNTEMKSAFISYENFEKNNFYSNEDIRYGFNYQKSNQIIIMLGNQTCSQFSPDYFSLKILESYLSYGMSSILFKLFRENNGLTYDIGVYYPERDQNAPFLTYLSVANRNAIVAFKILTDLWKELFSKKIIEEELILAKKKFESSLLHTNQTMDKVLFKKILHLSNDNIDYCFEIYLKKINQITPNKIMEVIHKYLKKPFLSVYGDEKICNEIKKIWIENFYI